VIIELGLSPDESRRINRLPAGRSFGEGQGGGWGTTLAILLDSKGHNVRLWVYEEDEAERMRLTRENATFLPGVRIPDGVGSPPQHGRRWMGPTSSCS